MFIFWVDVQSVHFQSNCHRYEMSQWTKCPVDVPFGSKCSVDVLLVDVPFRHRGQQCSETTLTGESWFHISIPLGIEPRSLMTGSKRVVHWTSETW
jgi:hypothetical protein